MGDITKIQWCDATFNPWIGCAKVAPGCEHCYAEADMDKRRHFALWGQAGTRVKTSDSNWRKPIKWNREAEAAGVRRRVFCASLADVFEAWGDPIYQGDDVLLKPYLDSENYRAMWDAADPENWHKDPQGWRLVKLHDVRRELFRLIDATPWLDWQLLTKRPENIRKMWEWIKVKGHVSQNEGDGFTGYRRNVWLGTSVSDQTTADKAIPALLKCRDLSPVLFLSAEPLLGPIDLSGWLDDNWREVDADHGHAIDWVIVGGESGPAARPCDARWLIDIAQQCDAAGVPCFVKQLGSNAWLDSIAFDSADPGSRLKLADNKGGNWDEWPADVPRVREFPQVNR